MKTLAGERREKGLEEGLEGGREGERKGDEERKDKRNTKTKYTSEVQKTKCNRLRQISLEANDTQMKHAICS